MYITVEPTTKQDKLLLARLSNVAVILLLLGLQKIYNVEVPESLYFIFGSAGAGLEIGQLVNLIKRK